MAFTDIVVQTMGLDGNIQVTERHHLHRSESKMPNAEVADASIDYGELLGLPAGQGSTAIFDFW